MSVKQIFEGWQKLERKTKLMAFGTLLLMGISICLSFSNCTTASETAHETSAAAEEGVLIESGSNPIPLANKETQLVASLIDILSNEECAWISTSNELCSIQFTENGYLEYYGDLQGASCTWEFYEIEITNNGRSGIWRITQPDGSTHDARFTFIHDAERGIYSITSSAFANSTIYETKALSSFDLN